MFLGTTSSASNKTNAVSPFSATSATLSLKSSNIQQQQQQLKGSTSLIAPIRRYTLGRSSLGGGSYPVNGTTPGVSIAHSTTDQEISRDPLHSARTNDHRGSHNRLHYPPPPLPSCNPRLLRQQYIAQILPVNDVLEMSKAHWEGLAALEKASSPMDHFKERESHVLGVKQVNMNRDHRHRIIKWMCEACALFKWSSQTFFTSAHAWDMYVTSVTHEICSSDLAKLSASSLYFGAQLVESAADENIRTLEEFREMCPEVDSAVAMRHVQAHLVDTLQGASLMRRTPLDFLMLYLAALQVAPSPCPKLFERLIQTDMLIVIWELVLAVALTVYANGLILDGIPGSYWVAGTLLRGLEFAWNDLRTDLHTRRILHQYVFHINPRVLKVYQTTVIDPMVKSVWGSLAEDTQRENAAAVAAAEGASFSGGKASARQLEKPYDVIRHRQFETFPKWPATFPSNRLVRELSTRLRTLVFDSNTPPTNTLSTASTLNGSPEHSTTASTVKKSGARDRISRGNSASTSRGSTEWEGKPYGGNDGMLRVRGLHGYEDQVPPVRFAQEGKAPTTLIAANESAGGAPHYPSEM